MTLRQDALDYAKRCDACQQHAPVIHQSSEQLNMSIPSRHFMRWGMDIVGKMPPAPEQKVFILAMTDYFSKWIEAEAFKQVTSKEVISFIKRNILCKFGVQSEIVCDNRSQFISDKTKMFCKRKWAEELPWVLWSDRTTPKMSTGQTPYSLNYGTEAVLPTEVMIPTERYGLMMSDMNNTELSHDKDTVDELKTFQNTMDVMAGKFANTWEGPYFIDAVIGRGAYQLSRMDGI
ncbi:uncharacterized protein LOC141673450 [Apium graveolens]|uniref:uncharacterized protein LOC141673450 n=1 Tax=Apium graveolens TaxID=4045 RepID=UPI003D7B8D2C